MITEHGIKELRRRYSKPKVRSAKQLRSLGVWADARSTETLVVLASESIPIISQRCKLALIMRGLRP